MDDNGSGEGSVSAMSEGGSLFVVAVVFGAVAFVGRVRAWVAAHGVLGLGTGVKWSLASPGHGLSPGGYAAVRDAGFVLAGGPPSALLALCPAPMERLTQHLLWLTPNCPWGWRRSRIPEGKGLGWVLSSLLLKCAGRTRVR